MVGKDGYCPMGHLARPDLLEKAQKAAAPPQARPEPPPPPSHVPPEVPAQPSGEASVWRTPSPLAPADQGAPQSRGAPPIPTAAPIKGSNAAIKAIVAAALVGTLVVMAVTFLGRTAGASNLRLKFVPGEKHTYTFEVTMRGSAGNLAGGFRTDQAIAAELTQETGAVDTDGSARLTYTIRNIHFTEAGRSIDAPPGVGGSFTVKIRKDGVVVGLDEGDPFGLEDINPAASFVNPANAGPMLPGRNVKPGESWTIEESQKVPDLGKLTVTATNTLRRRYSFNGNEVAEIRSVITVPLHFRIGREQLVKQAKNDGESTNIPKDAGVSMNGSMRFNLTQVIFTANGLLQSAIGDGAMTGSMLIEGLPTGPLDIVFNIRMAVTVLKKSTGLSA